MLALLFSLLIMSFSRHRLADKVAIDELKDGWGRQHKSVRGPGEGREGEKNGFLYRASGGNIKFITFPNNGGRRKDRRLFSADNVRRGFLNGGFN